MDLWQRKVTDRSTAQSNLLDSLPQLEWTQSLLMSPGKAAVGDGKRGLLTLLFTIPLKPILFQANTVQLYTAT